MSRWRSALLIGLIGALFILADRPIAQTPTIIFCNIAGTNQAIPCGQSNPLAVTPQANATGGGTPSHTLSGASDNATQLATGQHTVYSVVLTNTTTTVYYFKFYDTAAMTTGQCGSIAVAMTLPVPVSNNPQRYESAVGVQFNNGIGFCLTANIADNDDTSAAAGVVIDVVYK